MWLHLRCVLGKVEHERAVGIVLARLRGADAWRPVLAAHIEADGWGCFRRAVRDGVLREVDTDAGPAYELGPVVIDALRSRDPALVDVARCH